MSKVLKFVTIFMSVFLFSCATTSVKPDTNDVFAEENKLFLEGKDVKNEIFRVFISSDRYAAVQLKYENSIKRKNDPGGDQYIKDEIKKYNKIDEAREGVVLIWLYPDSGNIMKIRPQKLTYLKEIDELILDDIQRWNFVFPKKVVAPIKFEIRYRVMLRKKMSDEDIMKEVREKMLDKQ